MTSHIYASPALPATNRAIYLEPSPYEADGGHSVGRDPRHIPLAELRQLQHPESPIKAIRAKCIDCSGGSQAEARKCVSVKCPLWPMRMGVSTFHASRVATKNPQANFGGNLGSNATPADGVRS